MERKRLVTLIIVLSIWSIMLLYTFYYLYIIYNTLNGSENAANKYSQFGSNEVYSMSPLTREQLTIGDFMSVKKGDVFSFEINKQPYSIKVYGVDPVSKKVDFMINSFLYLTVHSPDVKKMDLDGDGTYDLLLSLSSINNNGAQISIKEINEKKTLGDSTEEAMTKIQGSYDLQIKIIVVLALVYFMILIFYYVKVHVIPAVQLKKKNARQKPTDALDDLIDEFNDVKKDKTKARILYSRVKHMVRYLPDSDKKKYETKIKSMERYIN